MRVLVWQHKESESDFGVVRVYEDESRAQQDLELARLDDTKIWEL